MQKATIKTKLLTALLTLCMVLSLVPLSAFAADLTVSNETELTAALENADCTEIKLGGNIETTWELEVERTVTLDLNGYTLSCSSTDEDIIQVRSSGNLTVKDSGNGGKIDGQNKNCGIEVKGGTLTLESGSIVNCTDADGDGGAVDISNTGVAETQVKYGKFIMNGGAIMDCKAGDDGGAVDIGSGCTFIMNGGTIGNCRADDDGGAVFIKQSGTFELNGGVIQNCSAGANGGAVNIYQDGRFTMTGGTIKSCKIDLGGIGGAVYGSNDKAVVTMTGGTFEDCGVFPYSFDEFTVTFDSDGGSAVPEQKLRNAPAVKPADPKKDGYDFAGWYLEDTQYAFDTKVTTDITLKAHWTPTSASTAIDLIEINGVTVSFKNGDKPVFTGKVPDGAKYAFRCEWWCLDSNTGLISTEPEWGSEIYNNKITAFEAGKTYHYGVYVSAYYDDFSPDAKLKINGQYVNYKRIGDENDTQSMWLETELTMTPQASGTTPDYKITEGANGSWMQNSNGTLKFAANGDYSKFTGVKVDGTLIAADKYTAVSGSTMITLKKDYLDTLSVGKHTLTVVYSDGECSTEFEIKAAQSGGNTTPDKPNPDDPEPPQTGDNSSLMLWTALLFISCSVAIGTTAFSKKKKHNS